MGAHGHRIWGYAALAWIALVVVPIGYAAVRWQMGLGHDPDMSGVGELILSMLVVITVPMATLAFGVLAPLAIGVDQLTNARTPRAVNVLIGAALSAPALVVAVVAVGGPSMAFGTLWPLSVTSAVRLDSYWRCSWPASSWDSGCATHGEASVFEGRTT